MLERLRALGQQRAATAEATPEPDTFQGAPTTVEPLPPADGLVDEEQRPTIKQIPTDLREVVRARTDQIVEGVVTSKLERVSVGDSTPAPLPPSPEAERAAASWFEQVPTSPAVPEMDPFAPGSDTGTGSAITPLRQPDGRVGYPPTRALRRQRAPGVGGAFPDRPWAIPTLIAATSLTVGMVLGALIFGGNGDGSTAAAAARDAGVCAPCPEAAPAGESAPDPGDGLPD